jgi:hypothetical protein
VDHKEKNKKQAEQLDTLMKDAALMISKAGEEGVNCVMTIVSLWATKIYKSTIGSEEDKLAAANHFFECFVTDMKIGFKRGMESMPFTEEESESAIKSIPLIVKPGGGEFKH